MSGEKSGPFVIFLMSLVPIPLCYVLNKQPWMAEPWATLWVGVLVLTLMFLVPYLAVRQMKNPDPILYVMGLWTFSCVTDLMIALGADGIIPEMLNFHREHGEPYLWTAYGTMCCYWDGLAHYGIYLWILRAVIKGKSYREVGLFWTGSVVNCIVVLLTGSAIGKFGWKPAVILNLPYLFIAVWVGHKLLSQRRPVPIKGADTSSIWKRPVDLAFVAYFVYACALDVFRGLTALGWQNALSLDYLDEHDPYLKDPVAYPKVQMIVYMFYCVPYYVCAIHGLVNPHKADWLPDWALLFAGAAAQGQFTHIGASFHHRTAAEFHVPPRSHSHQGYWLVNLSLLIVPQLFAMKQNYGRPAQKIE